MKTSCRKRRKSLYSLLIFLPLFLSILTGTVYAQQDDAIIVTLTSDRSEMTVGDIAVLSLNVQTPDGYRVTLPQLDETWGDFEIYSSSQPETSQNADGSQTLEIQYNVTLFSTGTHETPAQVLAITDPEGQIIEKEIPPVTISVTSVLTPDDTTLRDIKPQADMTNLLPLLWIALGLILLALIIWLAKRFLHRPDQKEDITPVIIDDRPAHQIALEELDRIESLNLLQNEKIIEHYSRVADCLRLYLENLLSIRALDRTTYELKQILKATGLQKELAGQFITLFLESDLVKFAKYRPERSQSEKLVGHARKLIESSKSAEDARIESSSNHRSINDRPL